MSDRAQHVLDAIDGALDDWSVSEDAMRWTPEAATTDGKAAPPISPPMLLAEVQLPQLGQTFRVMVEGINQLFADLGQAVADALVKFEEFQGNREDAELLPDEPPTDLRSRALWLVQHRNTGPARPPAGRRRRPRSLP